MAILISKYKTGIDFPPLTSGLTHVSGENTLTFPYKSGDTQERFSGVAGVHMLLINGGSLLLTDDTDTFTVAFGSSNITVTWLSQKYNLRDIDDVVFVFNAFAKPTSGVTRLIYTATAGQTVFTGNDTNGTVLSFDNDAVMVFQNDNYLETTDYTTSSGTTVTLGAGATNGDKISIITFDSVTDQTALNNAVTSATASATDAGQHRTTSQRWAVEADTASVVDADTGVDSNEYSSKAYAVGSNTPGGSSKDWASKTGSPVAGGEYSAKYWATSTPVTNVSTNIAAVTTVSTNIADVNTLNTNMTDIQTVADEIDNNKLQTVANNIASVVTAANDLNETTSEIDTVANSITNVDNVGGSIANVNSVAGQISPTNNISTVAGATTNIATTATNISSVNSVATNIANVNTVAGLQSDISTAITNTNQFNDTYHGPSSTAPSGSNVSVGDLWFDTTTPATMKVYNGSGWVNAGSAVNGTTNRQVYTVGTSSGSYSGSNGTFPVTYDAGFVDVFLNGVKLVNGSDFTATNGTSVVLASAAATNDIVDIISYGTFNLNNTDVGDLNDVDTTGVSNGQVLSYNNTSGNFEPATIDLTSRLAVAGGQMTGNITMSGSQTVDGRDLSVDGAKLDGIEASADVTDTANVVAALTAGTGITIAGNGTIASTASSDLVDDSSPQLGGALDVNGNSITSASNGDVTIDPNGTGDIVLDANVQIGTTTEGIADYGDTLTLADSDHCGMTIRSGTSSEGNVYFSDGTSGDAEYKGIVKYDHSSNAMSFWSNSLRRMDITSGGNVGIGTSSPTQEIHGYSSGGDFSLKLESASSTGTAYTMYKNADREYAVGLRGSASDTFQIIDFTADATRLTVDTSGNVGIGTASPDATLKVVSSGANLLVGFNGTQNYFDASENIFRNFAGAEKGRIDSNGFHFGGTDNNPQASSSSSGGELYYSTQYAFMGMYRPSNPCLLLNRTGSDGEIVQFRKSGSTVGTVSVNGSGTTYNTTSDIRLKQDIEPLVATDKLMQMNPVSYSWKADPDGPRSMGFIAQEMQEVMPEAVSTGDDEDAMMSMDYGRITPILVSALQDAHRKIDELAAEIAELKAN